jgi:2-keto-3-deoxy-L-rhamnonate aldolase RhmA
MIGRYDAPEVREVIGSVAAAAKAHSKWSGIITGDEMLLRFCCGLGMRFLSSGSELSALSQGATKQLERLNGIARECSIKT